MRVGWCCLKPRLLHPVGQPAPALSTLFRRLDVSGVAGCCLLPLSCGRRQRTMAADCSSFFRKRLTTFSRHNFANYEQLKNELCSEKSAPSTAILSNFSRRFFARPMPISVHHLCSRFDCKRIVGN